MDNIRILHYSDQPNSLFTINKIMLNNMVWGLTYWYETTPTRTRPISSS